MSSNIFTDMDGKEYPLKESSKTRFRPGVYVLVKNSKNEFMMILNDRSNRWEIPGGGLEIGEDLIECGVRELKEETGYDIIIDSENPYFIEKDLAYSRSKDMYDHGLNFFFIGKLLSEEQGKQNFAEGEKILEVEFLSIDKIKELDIVFWHKNAIEKFLLENNSK